MNFDFQQSSILISLFENFAQSGLRRYELNPKHCFSMTVYRQKTVVSEVYLTSRPVVLQETEFECQNE